MKRFVDEVDRSQGLLLPDRLEDYVHEDNPVRVVDAFVEALDLSELGWHSATKRLHTAVIAPPLWSTGYRLVSTGANPPPGVRKFVVCPWYIRAAYSSTLPR